MNLIIRRKGFTLLELLIVIVIVAVLLGLVLPFASDLTSKRAIENAVIQIQQDLLLLQNLSITHSTNDKFKITFLDNYSYKFEKDESGSNVVVRKPPLDVQIYDIKVNGVSVSFPQTFNFDSVGRFIYLANLQPCSAEIYLQLSSGVKQEKIVISPIGRVEVVVIK